MKKLLLFAAIAVVFYFLNRGPAPPDPDAGLQAPPPTATDIAPAGNDDPIVAAYEEQRSDVQVAGSGRVARILGDDSLGDRHQRFILRAALGTHRPHRAQHRPRASRRALWRRRRRRVSRVYEWNDKGGVVHWTHHDPQGQHEPGWLKHHGRTYE